MGTFYRVDTQSGNADYGFPNNVVTVPSIPGQDTVPADTARIKWFALTRDRDTAYSLASSEARATDRRIVWDFGSNLPIMDPNDPRVYLQIVPSTDVFSRGQPARVTVNILVESTLQLDATNNDTIRMQDPFGDFYDVTLAAGTSTFGMAFAETARGVSFTHVPRNMTLGEPGYVVHPPQPVIKVVEGDSESGRWNPPGTPTLSVVARNASIPEGTAAEWDITSPGAEGLFAIQIVPANGSGRGTSYSINFSAGAATLTGVMLRSGDWYCSDILPDYVVADARASSIRVTRPLADIGGQSR